MFNKSNWATAEAKKATRATEELKSGARNAWPQKERLHSAAQSGAKTVASF
jgi:hypothetical protein